MNVFFTKTAKKEYEVWQRSSPRINDKIEELITDIVENGLLAGKGKPEQLKHFKDPPRYSRHITQADRLVYCPSGNDLLIVSCKGHYNDK
jgi:toxin YoeB